MLKELISVFTGNHPLNVVSQTFNRMLGLTQRMLVEADEVYWGKQQSPEERTRLYENDIEVNKSERTIRKYIVAHLSGPSAGTDAPYALLTMSLVKDVERLGDYAKNLSEAGTFSSEPLPDDELVGEMREISRSVIALASETTQVFTDSNEERARELTLEGRAVSKRCDELVRAIARSNYSAALTVRLTLGVRFYKRIEAHLLNILSGIIMPLHKLDYYDEETLKKWQQR